MTLHNAQLHFLLGKPLHDLRVSTLHATHRTWRLLDFMDPAQLNNKKKIQLESAKRGVLFIVEPKVIGN